MPEAFVCRNFGCDSKRAADVQQKQRGQHQVLAEQDSCAGVLATVSLTGEPGSGELLFSQPVSRTEILAGKLLGLFSSIVIATLFGFGLAGTLIAFEVGTDGLPRFAGFVCLSLLLSLVFLALGALISVAFPARSRAGPGPSAPRSFCGSSSSCSTTCS